MNAKDLLKLLTKNGFEVVRIKGSHHLMHHKEKNITVIVPLHGANDLAIGTLNSILKKAGLK